MDQTGCYFPLVFVVVVVLFFLTLFVCFSCFFLFDFLVLQTTNMPLLLL